MRTMLALAFCLCFLSARAQRISIAPTSFKAWGSTPGYSSISIYHQGFGLHYFHPYKKSHWYVMDNKAFYSYEENLYSKEGFIKFPEFSTSPTFAISYTPINLEDIFRAGVIIFDTPFPSKPAKQVNALLDIGYTFNKFRLSYTHISNAYTGVINPGMDMITISYHLFKD